MISIIFPIRNEAGYIRESLTSILRQDYPAREMEVLIADGMSTDNTRAIVADLAAQYPQIAVRIIDNPGRIVPTGFNLALAHARGDIIVRVDGHTLIAPDYVRCCVEALRDSRADNVGGKMNAVGENPFGQAVAIATSTPFGIGGGRFHCSDQQEWVDTVYMGAWPRRVFHTIGLFDEELVRDQDDEFNYRLRAGGGRILLSPQIKSVYTVRGTPVKLWRQYFQYGYWKIRVLQKHPRQMSLRQFVPPVFVLGLVLSLLLAVNPLTWPFSLFIPASYVAANLFASVHTAARRGWNNFMLLPLTFAILHFSYGLGFLSGLLKFWNRWSDKHGQERQLVGEPTF